MGKTIRSELLYKKNNLLDGETRVAKSCKIVLTASHFDLCLTFNENPVCVMAIIFISVYTVHSVTDSKHVLSVIIITCI